MIKKILRKCKRVVNNIIFNIKLNSKHEEIIEFDPNYLEKLNKIQPMPTGDIDANNNIEYKYDLQIIVPCYNVEEYVEDCIKSILNQKTKYNYIVTIINDGSTDNTLNILKKFENDEHVELIDQENKGLSGARNTGLKNMKAKYITFVDSDDMLADNSIESLLDAAFSHEDADIIEANHFSLNNGMTLQNNRYKEKAYVNPTTLDGYAWGKLYKAELWKNFQFPEGFWFEDTILAYILFYKAKKAYVSNIYIYISLTSRVNYARCKTNYEIS